MDFYRESLNFPVFREIGVARTNPYNFKTPAEFLGLDGEDGDVAKAFFYHILNICKERLHDDYELFWILAIMRAVGTMFVPHARFGYVIKPIMDSKHWTSEEYEHFKLGLKKYQQEIVEALSLTAK